MSEATRKISIFDNVAAQAFVACDSALFTFGHLLARVRDIAVFDGMAERESSDVMKHSGQSHFSVEHGFCVSDGRVEEFIVVHAAVKIFDNAVHDMKDPQSMFKSGMRGAGVNIMAPPQLFDPAESLKVRAVDDSVFGPG